MVEITIEELQNSKPKIRGQLHFSSKGEGQIFIKLRDNTEKLVLCNCGGDYFEKQGSIVKCLACENEYAMFVADDESTN